MEIIEFVLGCIELLLAWRMALMLAIGITISALSLILLGTNALGISLAVISFASSFIYGMVWHRAAEDGR